ncbi:hypothetical protein PoB_000440400 [Plakobranchus ocellatus]|uniref:Uncharacterized protein n=1 Tax=Plakobranchus ocellatus TaxID=259542 RepID=A0AAV3Y6K5_9GAST|nr:hypothetical protein PoB_000440400 [Plakobranchus ocellatus]
MYLQVRVEHLEGRLALVANNCDGHRNPWDPAVLTLAGERYRPLQYRLIGDNSYGDVDEDDDRNDDNVDDTDDNDAEDDNIDDDDADDIDDDNNDDDGDDDDDDDDRTETFRALKSTLHRQGVSGTVTDEFALQGLFYHRFEPRHER